MTSLAHHLECLERILNNERNSILSEHKELLQGHINELKQQPASPGWRPIESAPKDGTRIMLWNGDDEPVFAHWDTSLEWGKGSKPINDWVSDWLTVSGYDAGAERVYNPTHWQPLPQPPQPKDCEAEGQPQQGGCDALESQFLSDESRRLIEGNEQIRGYIQFLETNLKKLTTTTEEANDEY